MKSVLVLGAGNMGETHVKEYQKMKNVHRIGVVDIRYPAWLDKADQGITYFSSFEEALEKDHMYEVVDICLPTYLHKKFVEKSAVAGKHIICEKPLANTLKDANEIIQICKKYKVNLYVGHVVRFFPEYQKAKTIIDSGGIGKPVRVKSSRNSCYPTAWNNWYFDDENSGGMILDLMIHDFDYLRWCFGEVEEVTFIKSTEKELSENKYALVKLQFENKVVAHVEGSWSHKSFHTKLEVMGDRGVIGMDSDTKKMNLKSINKNENAVSVFSGEQIPSPYYCQLEHFLDCIEQDRNPLVTLNDAYEAVKISLAAIESLKTDKPINLKTFN